MWHGQTLRTRPQPARPLKTATNPPTPHPCPRALIQHCLEHPGANVREVIESDPAAYTSADPVFETLRLCYNSLISTGDDHIANGKLLDVIRQVGGRAGGGMCVDVGVGWGGV